MNKTITCMGELLIDFICTDRDVSLSKGMHFIKKPGGAPANVAAVISKLGGHAQFAGAVGSDPFGVFLHDELTKHGVATDLLKYSHLPTTLAFVSLTADGERDFNFSRGADADFSLNHEEDHLIASSQILHFGSATGFLGGDLEKTYTQTLKKSHARGQFVSFDPNYRSVFWVDQSDVFRTKVKDVMPYVDLIKVSDEELALLTQTKDPTMGMHVLHEWGAKIVLVTLGAKGAVFSMDQDLVEVHSPKVKAIDATGAGDAFVGALLFQLMQGNDLLKNGLTIQTLKKAVQFACVAGALTCTELGAMEALSTLTGIESLYQTTYEHE